MPETLTLSLGRSWAWTPAAPGLQGRQANAALEALQRQAGSGLGKGAETGPLSPRQPRVAGHTPADCSRKTFALREDGPSPAWGDLSPPQSFLPARPVVLFRSASTLWR